MATEATKNTRAVRFAAVLALCTSMAIPAEGLRQKVYKDPPGILTVCYGHTGRDVRAGATYSLEQCRTWLNHDMTAAVTVVDECAPNLPEPVLAAFADAAYNMGPTIACDQVRSTAARYLRAGQLRAACDQLPRWDKANVGGIMVTLPGLATRRAHERDVCLLGVK
jgi:lysozyme